MGFRLRWRLNSWVCRNERSLCRDLTKEKKLVH